MLPQLIKSLRSESIHYVMIPESEPRDVVMMQTVNIMQLAIEMGRRIREDRSVNLKMPVTTVVVAMDDADTIERLKAVQSYICDVRYRTFIYEGPHGMHGCGHAVSFAFVA